MTDEMFTCLVWQVNRHDISNVLAMTPPFNIALLNCEVVAPKERPPGTFEIRANFRTCLVYDAACLNYMNPFFSDRMCVPLSPPISISCRVLCTQVTRGIAPRPARSIARQRPR